MTHEEGRAAERAAAEQARRAEINRQNSQHSTGPKTAGGKAKSSRNSFKHGFYSQQLCRTPEEAAALHALKADLRAEHQPGTTTEELLVDEMAEQYWRLKFARASEAFIFETAAPLTQLAACQRMMSSAERGFHKALATLRRLQAERGMDEAAPFSEPKTQQELPQPVEQAEAEPEPESGFVPQIEWETASASDSAEDSSPYCESYAAHIRARFDAALEQIRQHQNAENHSVSAAAGSLAETSGFVSQNPEAIDAESEPDA